jgi:uncharacterized membrane protein (DUF106 family)
MGEFKEKKGSFRVIVLVMLVTLIIAMAWDSLPFIKNPVHSILDPSIGALLNWNLAIGMLLIILLLSVVMTFIQKYTTNQKELKNIKKQQKEIQKEMKQHRGNAEKTMELNKKNMELLPKQMKLGMRSIVYTSIPLLFLFRWFYDYFAALGSNKILGMNWIIFYFIAYLIFSSILKKQMDVV